MRIIHVLLLIIITSFVFVGCRGEHVYDVELENQTNETVFVSVGYRDIQGNIVFRDEKTTLESLEIMSTYFSEDEGVLPVRVFNQRGELVFSENFTEKNMVRIDKHTFSAVINSTDISSPIE